jgi:hypothetical protein
MIDHEPPLTLTFGAILRVGVPVSILWMIGDAIDGGSQSFIGVPLLVAAGGWAPLSLLIAGSAGMSIKSGPHVRIPFWRAVRLRMLSRERVSAGAVT